MILPAAALLAYRRVYHQEGKEGDDSDNDNDGLEKTWTKQLAKEVDELQRPFRDAVLRCHGGSAQQQQHPQPQAPITEMVMTIMDPPPSSTTTSTHLDESSSSTSCFSSMARKEWIKAVFGTSI